MPIGWNGPDPVEASDADDYELGTRYRANVDITLTHARVWTGPGEIGISNRRARAWTTNGAQLGIATLPDNLGDGWTSHAFDTPVAITAGGQFVVSFSTGGNEGAAAGALAGDVTSTDGALTALAAGSVTPGNGIYNLSPGVFPATGSGNQSFYGADVVYEVGIGGNTAPRITQMAVTANGALAVATVVAEDDETLVGATYRFHWGDGGSDTVTTHPTASAQHTYTTSGVNAVLVTVTDADGASDHEARPVVIVVPDIGTNPLTQAVIEGVLAAVQTHALTSGWFEKVNGHEPISRPGYGLTAAVWIDAMQPVAARSGLNTTSYRLALMVRIYADGDTQPHDAIDPHVTAATAALIGAYNGDFTLGGVVSEVDVLGAYGQVMAGQAGWLRLDDGARMRVMTITLPVIINDVWEQVA